MTTYLDSENTRLVFAGAKADPRFWDSHWSGRISRETICRGSDPFVVGNTGRYLPEGSRILEGGCGKGDKVWALQSSGYNTWGIDCAAESVKAVNLCAPELKISTGDVRNLEFEDGFFDGYWSLGVIEHFHGGYGQVLSEMHRVVRRGGILFLTAPSMSPLRRLKARMGLYPLLPRGADLEESFYQYAFLPGDVIRQVEGARFRLLECLPFDGVKGLKDEVPLLRPPLQWVYDNVADSSPASFLFSAVDVFAKHFANHMTLYIFEKR
jgi:SAM-dependent methyltransferase